MAGLCNMCWTTGKMHQSRIPFSIGQQRHKSYLELMAKETPFEK
jgi:hypothetical protein